MSRSQALLYYMLTRLSLAPLMLWTIVTVVFLLLRAIPGDPVDAILGARAPEAFKEQMREQLGLSGSLLEQYARYIKQLLSLDLGESAVEGGQSVWGIIDDFFPATLELAVCSIAIAAIVGISVGAIAASKPNTAIDAGGRLFGILTYAVPMFWFGMVLQLIFAVGLRWFPFGTRFPSTLEPPNDITGLYTLDSLLAGDLSKFSAALHHITLPALTLGILISGIFERIVRANLRRIMKSDYVEAARARGVPEGRIVVAHALKNAMIPTITILGLTFASLLGGAILTEVTFSWPGLARRLFEAISSRDYPVVQGLVIFFGAIVVTASIAIDILNAAIDPRIRY